MAGRTFQMVDLIEMYVHWDAGWELRDREPLTPGELRDR